METLTYAEFNLWLQYFDHSLSEILERWGDRLVIGDNGIGLLEENDYEVQLQQSHQNILGVVELRRHNFFSSLNKRN